MSFAILFHFLCAQHVSDINSLAPELFFFLFKHTLYVKCE